MERSLCVVWCSFQSTERDLNEENRLYYAELVEDDPMVAALN